VKSKAAKAKSITRDKWDILAEEMRREGNKLTDAQRRHYRDLAFRIIYGQDYTLPGGKES
jgi:hypothetical protein